MVILSLVHSLTCRSRAFYSCITNTQALAGQRYCLFACYVLSHSLKTSASPTVQLFGRSVFLTVMITNAVSTTREGRALVHRLAYSPMQSISDRSFIHRVSIMTSENECISVRDVCLRLRLVPSCDWQPQSVRCSTVHLIEEKSEPMSA